MMVLKKPIDETTSMFLEVHIDFICFVASGCFGTNIQLLKIPVIDSQNKIREVSVNLFRQNIVPSLQQKFTDQNPTDFYTSFVVNNLLLIHEVYRQKIGTRDYAAMLARSITVLLAFQQLYFVERDLMQIFMHSFYMPTLDDCLSLTSNLEGKEVYMLMAAGEYYVIEMVRFLIATQRPEYAKEIIHLLVDFICKRATQPSKRSILFSLTSVAEVYQDLALNLDYKNRDGLIESSCMLMTETQEKLADLMNRYFEGVPEDKETDVFYMLDCYQRVAHLVSKIVLKSFVYLTESVNYCDSATHRYLQDRKGELGHLL